MLLVHGTFATASENWGRTYIPALTHAGFDVCSVDLPHRALVDIQEQAEYVVYGVRTIAARAGHKVGIVGASQGALSPRWAIKWWPSVRRNVADLVTLAGVNHGTVLTAGLAQACFASCWQMKPYSRFMRAVNHGDESPGDIDYTAVYSLTDDIVLPQKPFSTSELDGATNISLQSLCPGRATKHNALASDDAVGYWITLDALSHAGGANTKRFDRATCKQTIGPNMRRITRAGPNVKALLPFATKAEPALRPYAR